MSALVTPYIEHAPAVFDPGRAKKNDAAADAVINYAKKIKDWPMLYEAVDKKIADQNEFVTWWDAKVRVRQSPGRHGISVTDRRPIVSADIAEHDTGITKQQVSKWRRRLKEPDKYREMLYGAAYCRAMAETANTTATKWTGDPESYTPEVYIEAARRVLGEIDLDPASNGLAQNVVGAAEWFDETENGLLQEWKGRVFLNPPYSYPLVAEFIDKLCDEYTAGNVSAAILLTNNNTDTKWWHKAALLAAAVCFTAGRINFYKADGSITQPTNGQTFFYFGNDRSLFGENFSAHGLIMVTRGDL